MNIEEIVRETLRENGFGEKMKELLLFLNDYMDLVFRFIVDLNKKMINYIVTDIYI